MKAALWILGALLTLDAGYLGYFGMIRATSYEDAIGPAINGFLFGLPVAGAFTALLVVHLLSRRNSKSP